MTKITKEQLIEKLQHRIAVAANYPDVEEAQFDATIFKIALNSIQQEPVADFLLNKFLNRLQQFLDEGDFAGDERGAIAGAIDCGKEMLASYTAPQPLTEAERAELQQYRTNFQWREGIKDDE